MIKSEISQWLVAHFNIYALGSRGSPYAKKALMTFFIIIKLTYLEKHDRLLIHMHLFHISWLNWHVGPSVDSIRGRYKLGPYYTIQGKL